MAFPATVAWDVRTTGSNNNGGGFDSALSGTDYSVQDAAQFAYTDLVIDAASNTKITSAAHPFDATSPGNIINITGGTGFTVQRVLILSVAGAVATCHAAVGTTSSTGGTGNLGGGLATIAQANSLAVLGNSIYIQAGTYTLTATITTAVATLNFIGYAAAHGDAGTKPLITTATNSISLFETGQDGGVQVWDNLSMSNTAGTRAAGIRQISTAGNSQYWIVKNCILDGFTYGLNSNNAGATFDVANVLASGCEIKNCTADGLSMNKGYVYVYDCWIHNCPNGVAATGGSMLGLLIDHSLITANTLGVTTGNTCFITVTNSTIANNTNQGLFPASNAGLVQVQNSIIYGNGANLNISYAGTAANIARAVAASRNNAIGSSTGWGVSGGDVTLSGSPFTSSTDFSLNSTAGAGAACQGAGYPGVFPGGLSTGVLDLGAVQTAAAAGGGQTAYPFGG